jgi:16S rRNA (cytosine967-C5)-methyltransferase
LKYFRSRYTNALRLLDGYQYPEPFHITAKNFFKLHKKFGSKDRKAVAEVAYTYFRCGKSLSQLPVGKGLLISSLLLEFDEVDQWNSVAKEAGLDTVLPDNFFQEGSVLKTIAELVGTETHFYPDGVLMSDFEHYNDAENARFRPRNWAKDHLDQEPRKLGVLGAKELALNTKLEDTTQVQDLSSQYTCSKIYISDGDNVWDACSGGGGKSLNLIKGSGANFYLSDIRPGILENAKARFKAMFYKARYAVADLSKSTDKLHFGNDKVGHGAFDVIVADVPCSGSGTWYRTPEHFSNFKYEKLGEIAERQKQIVKNSLPFLRKGGRFYYITCSVFSAENNEVKEWILANTDLTLEEEMSFDGIAQKADGMYMTSFILS